MRGFWSAILAILVILSVLVVPFANAAPVEAAACTYVLGFQTVHDAIPDTVGDCKVNVHYNPANGDGLQETNNGLMVWRKADNFTAFTDGYRSWVNGPYGIMQRLNTERFDWEPIDPQAIALNLNDMPSGATADKSYNRYVSNDEMIKTSKDPAKTAVRLAETGRINGYSSLFSNATASGLAGTAAVESIVAVYQTNDGAHLTYQDVLAASPNAPVVSAPQIGEESSALSATMSVGNDKDKTTLNTYVLVFRKGNVVAMIVTAGIMGKLDIQDTIKYAQVVESRIK